jgi:hypothetical protein
MMNALRKWRAQRRLERHKVLIMVDEHGGPIADAVHSTLLNVWFVPDSDRIADIAEGPSWAMKRHHSTDSSSVGGISRVGIG